VNPKVHVATAGYSYRSGAMLSQTDANSKTTSFAYDGFDRLLTMTKPTGGTKEFVYSAASCSSNPPQPPYVEIKEKIDATPTYLTRTNTYGSFGQVTATDVPHREGQSVYQTNYNYDGVNFLGSVTLPEGGTISYLRESTATTVTNTDGKKRRYTYQEDRKVSEVLEEDASGQLTVATSYTYDGMARLTEIQQGIQTRSFTYDDLGRLKTETHPESGTTTYT
jgi:YD repeat-containing protein